MPSRRAVPGLHQWNRVQFPGGLAELPDRMWAVVERKRGAPVYEAEYHLFPTTAGVKNHLRTYGWLEELPSWVTIFEAEINWAQLSDLSAARSAGRNVKA